MVLDLKELPEEGFRPHRDVPTRLRSLKSDKQLDKHVDFCTVLLRVIRGMPGHRRNEAIK